MVQAPVCSSRTPQGEIYLSPCPPLRGPDFGGDEFFVCFRLRRFGGDEGPKASLFDSESEGAEVQKQ